MIVGFITIKRSSWNQTVSAPKPRTRNPDIHSIGDILPSFHFGTAIAMTIATMKASVPLNSPVVAAKAQVQPEENLLVRNKKSRGPKLTEEFNTTYLGGGTRGRGTGAPGGRPGG